VLNYIAEVVIQQSANVLRNGHASLLGKLTKRSACGFMDANGKHCATCQLWRQSVGIRAGIATEDVHRKHGGSLAVINW
jgi:hypothetical protein